MIVILRHLLGAFHRAGTSRSTESRKVGSLGFSDHLHAHHGQQAGKHRSMNAVRIPRTAQRMRGLLIQWQLTNLQTGAGRRQRVADLELQLLAHLPELRDQILPLAHPEPAEIFGSADTAQRIVARIAIRLEYAIPDIQRRKKITGFIRIPVMNAVGFLTLVIRALAGVLQAEERHHHEHRSQKIR